MIKVGLSGNIQSGKETTSKLFKQIGIPVFDADVILKFILNYNYEINYKIRNYFGDVFTLKGDLLNLNKFTKKKFDELLDIVEYELLNAYDDFNRKNKGKTYTIFKSSILFEREWNSVMNYNINVYAPKGERKDRLTQSFYKEKNTPDILDINKLLTNEMDELVKNSLSDFVINNYNSAYPIYGDICEQINKADQRIIDTYLLKKQTIQL